MGDLLTAVCTLAAVAIGGVIAHVAARAAFRRELASRRDDRFVEKLENIAEVACDIAAGFRKGFGIALSRVESFAPVDSPREPIPISRLVMLVRFYAPEIRPEVDCLFEEREKAGEALAESSRSEVRSKEQRQDLIARLFMGSSRIEKACDAIVDSAAKTARERLGAIDRQE
ncbi:MAG: hypothetical protein JW940_28840 [Polyangiaceae bacterium]|nr:hypothetical protein [Polyangiaceae bacterium]